MPGSPPHMRGKADAAGQAGVVLGITPAHAGKSPAAGQRGKCIVGSPPHMRGKEPEALPAGFLEGITPAHAGKSNGSLTAPVLHMDHPRTCGEKRQCYLVGVATPGSPPHMRGKAAGVRSVRWAVGITPAHAGKSAFLVGVVGDFGDHPRTCGEKSC